MSFTDDFSAAVTIVDNVYAQALEIARRHGLSIKQAKKPAKLSDRDWSKLLKIDGNQPEYRIGFDVSISNCFGEPGTASVWSLVTNLSDGTWQQYLRKDTPLADLQTTIEEGLKIFDEFIKKNEGLDPIEEARKQSGYTYYWDHENDDGYRTYSTEFEESSSWCATVAGDGDDWEAELTDQDGQVIFEKAGGSSKELILAVEAKYAELTKPATAAE